MMLKFRLIYYTCLKFMNVGSNININKPYYIYLNRIKRKSVVNMKPHYPVSFTFLLLHVIRILQT